jgi:hypothetical protein
MDTVRRAALVVYLAVAVMLVVIILIHLFDYQRGVSWASFALPASYFLWLAFDLRYRRWRTKHTSGEDADEE